MLKAFKYKLRRPSKAFAAQCESALEVCRELYNAALQERRDAWKLNRQSVSWSAQCAQLPQIKPLRPDVAEVHSQVLQATLRRLQRSFENFFRRVKAGEKEAGWPRFKSRRRFDSFTYSQSGFRLAGDKLSLSKIGSCRVHLSREIEGTIKTCTIKREADGWYVIFTADNVPARELPQTGATVGVDLGLENFATFSNGAPPIPHPRHLRAAERRLKTAQRAVSRKKKRGANRKKAVKLLAKQQQTVKRQRQDFAHKESLHLLRQYDEIAVEDLNIKGMVKNHHLAKAISDAAWGTFLNILEAKAEEAAKRVWKVSAPYTSQDCSVVGTG